MRRGEGKNRTDGESGGKMYVIGLELSGWKDREG